MLYVALQQSFREEVGMEEVSFLSTSSIPRQRCCCIYDVMLPLDRRICLMTCLKYKCIYCEISL